jgi:hypothetical protein
MNIIPDLNWNQYKAAGRNVASYAAGGVTVAVFFGWLSAKDGTSITQDINLITTGMGQVLEGIAGLIAVLTPIYTMWRASIAASPSTQVKEVVKNLSASQITQAANEVADPGSRAKLIEAVADMPEVKRIVSASPQVARSISSEKVTSK